MIMSLVTRVLIILTVLACASCTVNAGGLRNGANMTRTRSLEDSQICNIQIVDAQFEDSRSDTEKYKCLVDGQWNGYNDGIDDFAYDITLPANFLTRNEQAIRQGDFYIAIPDGQVVDDGVNPPHVTVPDASTVAIVHGLRRRQRRKLQATRTNSILVVRVSTNRGDRCDPSSNDIAGSVFGLGSNPLQHSMKSQYEACSQGKQSFRPVTGDNNVINGVVEVTIDKDIDGTNIFSLTNAMNQAATAAVGNSLDTTPDHVMYCVPPGTKFDGRRNWVAFAYVNGVSSYYNNYWCDRLSSQVHEIGHNLGMHHSNENGGEYGDQSGMMGFSYPYRDGPLMCFNAFKQYEMGWYAGQTRSITGDWTGDLAAFVDAGNTNKDVILKMGNVYMQLNRRKGVNAGTREKIDEVVLVEGTRLDKQSSVLAGLGEGEKYSVNGKTVEVCSLDFSGIVDYAKVSIYNVGASSGCSSTKGAGGSCNDVALSYFVVDGSVRNCAWVESQANYYNSRGQYWQNYGAFCQGFATTACKKSCNTCP